MSSLTLYFSSLTCGILYEDGEVLQAEKLKSDNFLNENI